MKRTLALVALPFALAACGGDEVIREKETVVERPVVTERVIVDRPSAAVGASAPACTYSSRSYSAGSVSCQEGREFRCTNGAWERTETFC